MVVWVATGLLAYVFVQYAYNESLKQKRFLEATSLRDAMYNKLLELQADPSMTDLKWLEWLKIFRELDQYVANRTIFNITHNSLEEMARKNIDDPVVLKIYDQNL